MWIKPVQKGVNKNQDATTTKLYTCKGSVQFFSIKPLIINKKVYNFIFPGNVKFSSRLSAFVA